KAATVVISVSSVAGAVANVLTGGAATQTAAATYAVTAGFVPTHSAHYNTLTGLSAGNFVINKAPVTATAGGGTGTYNGLTQSPSACAVTGAYTGSLSCLNTPAFVGPDANTYTITPNVIGDTTNFLVTLTNGSYKIDKATSTTTVTGGTFTYDGNPHPATVSITGAGLNLTPAPSYSGGCSAAPVYVYPVYVYETTPPTPPPTPCTASYTYAGDANHTGSSGSRHIFLPTSFSFN